MESIWEDFLIEPFFSLLSNREHGSSEGYLEDKKENIVTTVLSCILYYNAHSYEQFVDRLSCRPVGKGGEGYRGYPCQKSNHKIFWVYILQTAILIRVMKGILFSLRDKIWRFRSGR